MIYLPKRALFIHIPRTAGHSITNTIASECAGNNYDILISTNPNLKMGMTHWSYPIQVHSTASILKKTFPDDEWDNIFKFSIYRPEEERLNSVKRLIERDISQKTYEHPACDEGWKKILINENSRNRFYENFKRQDLDYFIKHNGEDLGIETFNFYELSDVWNEICDKCNIPRCYLKHLNKC
jgi:hypothetical protein